MGMLIDGIWSDDDGKSRGSGGKFDHLPTNFRDYITADGQSGFKAELGRYYIYATKTCPWAHRTLLFRHLKGLEDAIGLYFAGSGEEGYRVNIEGSHKVPGTAAREGARLNP